MFAKNRNDFAHVLRGLEFENALPLERQSSVRTRQGVGRRVGQSKPCSAPLDRNCPSISGVRFDGTANHDAGRFGCVSKHRQTPFGQKGTSNQPAGGEVKAERTADKNTGFRANLRRPKGYERATEKLLGQPPLAQCVHAKGCAVDNPSRGRQAV